MSKGILLLLVLTMLIFLGACSGLFSPPQSYAQAAEYEETTGDPQPIERPDDPVQAFPDDGVLRLAMRHPLTLNPLLNEDATVAPILRLLFEPLVIFDDTLRVVGHLAHMEMSSDFSRATVAIRHDAIWSDGMPVTSDDLIFSVGVLRQAPDTVIYKQNVNNIASIERIDSRTVVIVFERPSIMAGHALNFPIIPEHYYRGHNNPASARNMQPLGNGPYLLEAITPMQSLVFTQSPYTFRHRASIKTVEVLFIPDEQSRLYAFDQGIIDAIRIPFSEWVKHHSVRQVHHEEFLTMYFEFIGFNFHREIFTDINIRQGISYTFNVAEAMGIVYSHQGVHSVSPIHPSSWMHDETIEANYDIARAATLLRNLDNEEPLEILVNIEHIERVHIAERLVMSLDRVGVMAEVVVLPFEEYHLRLMEGDFDLFFGGMQLGFEPDFAFMFQGGELFGVDPIMEELFAGLHSASTETAYLQAVSALQRGFVERAPIISLGFRHSAVLTGTRVVQDRPPASDHVLAFVNEWRIVP
ncbi:MAG: ABC transporter substrate-binding protein [Defluviitaleaceae bacterium]|nr:ABC transporter substrate-binding protein [Defluviitaleaceae bacterium]